MVAVAQVFESSVGKISNGVVNHGATILQSSKYLSQVYINICIYVYMYK